MNKTKPKSSGGSSLLLFFAFLIGGIIGYLAFKADAKPVEKEKKLSNEYARVDTIQNLYVFIQSYPANPESYETLGSFISDGQLDTVKTAEGQKESLSHALCRLFYSDRENLPFDQRLSQVITNVRTNFPEATGVIFSDRMRKCDVIKFKPEPEE